MDMMKPLIPFTSSWDAFGMGARIAMQGKHSIKSKEEQWENCMTQQRKNPKIERHEQESSLYLGA